MVMYSAVINTTVHRMNPSWGEIEPLASCPWGPVTANGVELLTEIYCKYIWIHAVMQVIETAGEHVTGGRKES